MILDTEDEDDNDAIDPDGKEDTGLDGILDEEERLNNSIEKLIQVEIISFSKEIQPTLSI
jgi:hypothetical protein